MQGVFAYIGTFGDRKMSGACSGGYTFGFNGQMKDDEVYGEASAYDFGARLYDSRIGRWLSIDPLQKAYPSLSSYQGFANNPILMVDPTGAVIINGHSDDNPANKKKVDNAISLLQEHNVELYTFLQTARVTSNGETIYKTPDGQIVCQCNSRFHPSDDIDLNALYETSMDVNITVVIADIDGKSGEKERIDFIEKQSSQNTTHRFTKQSEKHIDGRTDGPAWDRSVPKDENGSFIWVNDSDEGKVYLTDKNINNVSTRYVKLLRVDNEGKLNYDFTVKLDDFIEYDNNSNVKYGEIFAHEGGHIKSELLNALAAYYFKVIKENRKNGHEDGNPSGKNADQEQENFLKSYNNKSK